jgi:hypothetical protein
VYSTGYRYYIPSFFKSRKSNANSESQYRSNSRKFDCFAELWEKNSLNLFYITGIATGTDFMSVPVQVLVS